MTSLTVVVHGTPAPQGSKRHVGRGVMVESSAKVRPWRALVTAAAVDAMAELPEGWYGRAPETPLTLYALFTLARPVSHYRTGRNAHLLRDNAPDEPVTRPDLDKLLRSTFDALTDAGAIHDDARVTWVYAAKVYPGGHVDALDTPGAVLVIADEW